MNDPAKETWQFDDPAVIKPDGTERGHSVARVYCYKPTTHEECVARGHLMAAAPELYRALEALVTEHGGTLAVHAGDPKAEAARAALAKARGESHER